MKETVFATKSGILPPPKSVPVENPITFALLPSTGSYWPVVTNATEGRLVSYETEDNKIIGREGRKFLANRTTSNGEARFHVAVDLFGKHNDFVFACEDGKIIAFKYFYKAKSGDNTYCLLIRHNDVIINYGEVTSDSLQRLHLKVGDIVKAGQHIGFVSSTDMLHFETYDLNGNDSNLPQRWMKKNPNPPVRLLNPTKYLLFLQTNGLRGTSNFIEKKKYTVRLFITGLLLLTAIGILRKTWHRKK